MLEVFLSPFSGVRTSGDAASFSLLGSARTTWRTAPRRTSFDGASSGPGEWSGVMIAGDDWLLGVLAADLSEVGTTEGAGEAARAGDEGAETRKVGAGGPDEDEMVTMIGGGTGDGARR